MIFFRSENVIGWAFYNESSSFQLTILLHHYNNNLCTIFYLPQRSWGKVIFSEVRVKDSVHRGVCMVMAMHGRGACVVGGAWQGDMHGRRVMHGGHVWQGAWMAGGMHGGGMHGRGSMHGGGMHGRGCTWQGAYVVGGAWQGACVAGEHA